VTRGLLLINPKATTVNPRMRDVIAHALDDVVSLDVVETKRREHAAELARDAAASGIDILFCLGGDGTLNEALNGLGDANVTLAVLPGGGTNVFARTLGLPRDPIDATATFIERLRDGTPPRRVSLGTMNGRRFAFCAGVGYDAEVVRGVHRKFERKQKYGDAYFVTTALRLFFFGTNRRTPALTFETPDGTRIEDVFVTVVGKSDPYTFLGSRPFRLTPSASLDGGLDVLALRSMRVGRVLGLVFRGFTTARYKRAKHVSYLHDLDAFTVRASRPVAVHVDGEDLGELTEMRFGVVRDALSVLA
jgi:diacylglycerol kinase family enzyme